MNDKRVFEATEVPGDFVELSELGITSVEHKLGYFGNDPLVIFGYCVGGGEIIWRDSQGSGFGTGAWRTFLDEIAPLASRYGVHLGSIDSAGSHVLLIDRHKHFVYAAPRESAERFLCHCYGLPTPKRQCLCGLMNCATCASLMCTHAQLRPNTTEPESCH
jgi:hypothetical protein